MSYAPAVRYHMFCGRQASFVAPMCYGATFFDVTWYNATRIRR